MNTDEQNQTTQGAAAQEKPAAATAKSGDDPLATLAKMVDDINSEMLDSTVQESFYAVKTLTKKPDGTTLVPYYLTRDAAEADKLCADDPMLQHPPQGSCTFLPDDTLREVREVIQSIATESKAKIEFQEVSSLKDAYITFARRSHVAQIGEDKELGHAGRADGKNFALITLMEDVLNERPKEQESKSPSPSQEESDPGLTFMQKHMDEVRKIIKEKYQGDPHKFMMAIYDKGTIAHEIEHTLGAKHPESAIGHMTITKAAEPEIYNQSVMGDTDLETLLLGVFDGKILGHLDDVWYQRHFGPKEVPADELQKPAPAPADAPVKKYELQ